MAAEDTTKEEDQEDTAATKEEEDTTKEDTTGEEEEDTVCELNDNISKSLTGIQGDIKIRLLSSFFVFPVLILFVLVLCNAFQSLCLNQRHHVQISVNKQTNRALFITLHPRRA